MSVGTPPTTKGVRQSQAILEAALVCVGRDGYAATSLARVAEEAGVSKRMVLYYFDSRETLFTELTRAIGDRILSILREAVAGIEEPAVVVQKGFEQVWTSLTADRGLLIALFGVTTESVTDERLSGAVDEFNNGMRDFLRTQLQAAHANGRKIVVHDEVAVTAMLAGFNGLLLDWLQRGDSDDLAEAIKGYQALIASLAPET